MFQKRICTKNNKSVAGNRMSDERTGFGRKAKEPGSADTVFKNPAPWWMVTVGAFLYGKRGTDSTAECKYHKNSDLYRGDGTM